MTQVETKPMVRNLPSPEGAKMGAQLARFTDLAVKELLVKFPNHQDRCGTCAFRLGTIPNQCVLTVMDALKAVCQQEPFMCHEHVGEPCNGWIILAFKDGAESKTVKCPWEYSE